MSTSTEQEQPSSLEEAPLSIKPATAADESFEETAATSGASAASEGAGEASSEQRCSTEDAAAASSAERTKELRNNSYKKERKSTRSFRRGSATLTRTHGSITRTMSKIGSGLRMSKRLSQRKAEEAAASTSEISGCDNNRQIRASSSAPSRQASTDMGGEPGSKLPSWKLGKPWRNAEPFVPEVKRQSKSGSFIKAKKIGRTVSRVFSVPKNNEEGTRPTHTPSAPASDPVPVVALEKNEESGGDGVENEAEVPVTRGSFALSDDGLSQLPQSTKSSQESAAAAEAPAQSQVATVASDVEKAADAADADETRDAPSVSVDVFVSAKSPMEHQLSDTAPIPPPIVSRKSSEMVAGPRESTDMTLAPASPTPLVKSGSKASDVLGDMSVSVAHSGYDHGHPLFTVHVTIDGELKYMRKGDRFATFRNLAIELELIDVAEIPFPKTYLKNKFGVKLTQAEISERAAGLRKWFNSLAEAELPRSVMKALLDFFTPSEEQGRTKQQQEETESKNEQGRAENEAAVVSSKLGSPKQEVPANEEADSARASLRLSQ